MDARRRRCLPCALAAGLTLSVPVALYRFLPEPVMWTAAFGVVCCVLCARDAVWPALRIAAVGFALASGVLFAAEAVLRMRHGAPIVKTEQQPAYLEADPWLGFRLHPAETSRAAEWIDDSVVYDVHYTVDSSGHRWTPAASSGASCVAFLVDGFTFGMGVEDEQTLPARVASRAHRQLNAVNLGVPGYGANHALAMLDSGPGLPCRPSILVYQVVAHDVLRVAGYGTWAFTPRYHLDPDGALRSLGTPRAPTRTWRDELRDRIRNRLELSRVFRRLADREPEPTPDEVRLFIRVMAALRAVAETRYPGIRLEVLLWQGHGWTRAVARLDAQLDSIGYHVHIVDGILPGYRGRPELYQLHPDDARPNARAYDLLAAFVVDSLIDSR